jgi:catalase
MMDGGVNTFRFINEEGKAFFVNYWRALLGAPMLGMKRKNRWKTLTSIVRSLASNRDG